MYETEASPSGRVSMIYLKLSSLLMYALLTHNRIRIRTSLVDENPSAIRL